MKKNQRAIVMTAATTPSSSCKGKYRRVAVVIVDTAILSELNQERPAMIADRAKGVVEIAATWENCSVGKTDRCAYAKALVEAEELAKKLNSK